MNKLFFHIRQHRVAIIIIAILSILFILFTTYFVINAEKMKKGNEDLLSYNKQMGELFLALQDNILSTTKATQQRELFIIYSADYILKHYNEYKSNLPPMTPTTITTFLSEIYSKSLIYNIDPFLPLAFAQVETHFYNDAIGQDGERSVFQFMDMTARETYRKINKPFLPNWYQDPQESVTLWFAYYHELNNNFIHESEERSVRWTALAYNAGLYRNGLRRAFNTDQGIDQFVNQVYISKGNKHYNREVWNTYLKLKQGFELK
jgi:hypothetical protein